MQIGEHLRVHDAMAVGQPQVDIECAVGKAVLVWHVGASIPKGGEMQTSPSK